jgi:nitrite reductase/ring-hydroxylating ferredoxin subunit
MILTPGRHPSVPGAVGARNGSQRVQPSPDRARRSQNLLAGEGLPARLSPTVTDSLEFPTEEVTGSNPVRPTPFFENPSSAKSPNGSQPPAVLALRCWSEHVVLRSKYGDSQAWHAQRKTYRAAVSVALRTRTDCSVRAPRRERHQDDLVVELMHGGRWVGHPLHPALSDLPIGLWAGVMVLDATDRDRAPRARNRRRRHAHRGRHPRRGRHGLDRPERLDRQQRSGPPRRALPPRRWTRALQEADLPDDSPTAVVAEGRQIMLYRHRGRLYAIDNICSHAGGLLSRGPVADLTVTCPLHGSRFALADGCVSRGPASQPQPVLPTRIRNGWVEVRGSLPAPRRPAKGRTQP